MSPFLLFLALLLPASAGAGASFEGEGLRVTLSFEDPAGRPLEGPMEGQATLLALAIESAASGQPVKGLTPAAWVDRKKGDRFSCRDKIQAFLSGQLAFQPDIDLTSYYILSLNEKASISVIDPLRGLGTTKVVTRILLDSPGADWVLDDAGKHLYVTLPDKDRVAVVDTLRWKVAGAIPAGPRPDRIAFQPDGRYLWVTLEGGVAVLDPEGGKAVAFFETGEGPHRLAFSEDSRHAFVIDRGSGTLSVVGIRELAVLKAFPVGESPVDVAFSPHARAAYIVDEGGVLTAVGDDLEARTPLSLAPGLSAIRFSPGGRYGLILNGKAREVLVLDAARNRIVQRARLPGRPDQIAFSETSAYVHLADSERVVLIKLEALGEDEALSFLTFTGGRRKPSASPFALSAQAIYPTPEGNAVVIAHPADKTLYYYREGMTAPMGSYRTYGRVPRGVLVVDRGLKEVGPGIYAASVTWPRAGTYDVAFLLDVPVLFHCFSVAVAENPAVAKKPELPVELTFLHVPRLTHAKAPASLTFRLVDAETGVVRPHLRPRALVVLAPGTWQRRIPAEPLGEGRYRVAFTPPKGGIYYVFVEIPELGVRTDQLPHADLLARAPVRGKGVLP